MIVLLQSCHQHRLKLRDIDKRRARNRAINWQYVCDWLSPSLAEWRGHATTQLSTSDWPHLSVLALQMISYQLDIYASG
jgi:hypothetical protein